MSWSCQTTYFGAPAGSNNIFLTCCRERTRNTQSRKARGQRVSNDLNPRNPNPNHALPKRRLRGEGHSSRRHDLHVQFTSSIRFHTVCNPHGKTFQRGRLRLLQTAGSSWGPEKRQRPGPQNCGTKIDTVAKATSVRDSKPCGCAVEHGRTT